LFERLVLSRSIRPAYLADHPQQARRIPGRLCRVRGRSGRRLRPERHRRLLAGPGIVRNRLKIDAAVENAQRIKALRASHGSFSNWLEAHQPRPIEAWTLLFRRTFRFTGGQIVTEFGYLPGAHEPDCPAYARVLEVSPPWARPGSSDPLAAAKQV
jgi:hypothetical protein